MNNTPECEDQFLALLLFYLSLHWKGNLDAD